jgi:hypothetical protein
MQCSKQHWRGIADAGSCTFKEMNMAEMQIFSSEGKLLSAADAKNAEVIAAGMVANNVAHAFKSREEFTKWSSSTRYFDVVQSIEKKTADARKHQKLDHSAIEARQKKLVARVEEDMKDLAARTKLEPNSEALFLRATSESDPLEGPIFDPITAFDSVGSGGIGAPGPWIHLPGGGWPDLRWFGWNDRISSLRVSGFVTMYEHIWWQGRTLFLAGFPVWYYPNFGFFGFDNIASSAWVA